ncbi:hypothetical protein GGX14DRAFT_397404 [Mycena pura]|uniref:Uncharacterized protein n=1 Tax=Mycena pura TaxID=153505 RepID=A0AAD6V8P8_9AGAR|nr:hypothetical protein GGX14DRAFT_397404 [Mycena pura]
MDTGVQGLVESFTVFMMVIARSSPDIWFSHDRATRAPTHTTESCQATQLVSHYSANSSEFLKDGHIPALSARPDKAAVPSRGTTPEQHARANVTLQSRLRHLQQHAPRTRAGAACIHHNPPHTGMHAHSQHAASPAPAPTLHNAKHLNGSGGYGVDPRFVLGSGARTHITHVSASASVHSSPPGQISVRSSPALATEPRAGTRSRRGRRRIMLTSAALAGYQDMDTDVDVDADAYSEGEAEGNREVEADGEEEVDDGDSEYEGNGSDSRPGFVPQARSGANARHNRRRAARARAGVGAVRGTAWGMTTLRNGCFGLGACM